jgi:hypothetical protein
MQKSAPFFKKKFPIFFKLYFFPEKSSFVYSKEILKAYDAIIANVL